MPDERPSAELGSLFEATGRSLGEAQGSLVGDRLGAPTSMAVSEAELELKAAVETAQSGGMVVHTLSAQEVRSGEISPGTLSTVRMRFVAVTEDRKASAAPRRSAAEVVGDVRGREDVSRLEGILGALSYEATFVPEASNWLVTATDSRARRVREVVLSDDV